MYKYTVYINGSRTPVVFESLDRAEDFIRTLSDCYIELKTERLISVHDKRKKELPST
jgi:hypothetical protein